jgi:hypothetical protein
MINSATSTTFIDNEIINYGIEYIYSVIAIDIHDNLSQATNIQIQSGILGDSNADNQKDISDIIISIEIIMGLYEHTEYQISVSDYDQNTIVNVNDIVMVVNLIINQ